MRLGATEILLILMIALVVFGSSKLTGLGKVLGTSIREFKQEVSGADNKDGSVDNTKKSQQEAISTSDDKVGDGSAGEVTRK